MSILETIAASTPAHQPISMLNRIEQRLERLSEHLNPILVKEARQALKSKQFTITFALMLIAAWMWSVAGIVSGMPDIYYAPSGMTMLIGYYFILAIPLLLIVPFSAFRSLAAEREDLTYELLSISTLTSRQIVTGKLGSAVLQMLVYYSAIAPCIAFTYLLRGVDIVSLVLLMVYTFGLSVLLCCAGLVFAGLARSRQWQSLVSVILLLGLIAVGFAWGTTIGSLVFSGLAELPLDSVDFWIGQAAVATAFLTYTAILILVASAQNSFPSDNRSTRIRIAVFVQTILFVGWVGYAWTRIADPEFMLVMMLFAMIHWYVYGILMSGESAQLSPRVRRSLPMSFMGRTFLTWFNPGSGTGYVFAVSHVLMLMGLAVLALVLQSALGIPSPRYSRVPFFDTAVTTAVLLVGYYTAYLGIARLLLLMVRQRERFGLALPVLINLILLLAGCAIPFIYEVARNRWMAANYTPLQAPNWFWTFEQTFDNATADPTVLVLVLGTAAVVLIINLIRTRTEIESVRMDAPERVKLDDEALSRQDKTRETEAVAT
jgi:hypothetical protein